MMESKLVGLILYISIHYDRGYLGVRIWLPTPPPDICRIVTSDFLSPPFSHAGRPPASHTLRDEYLVGVVKFAVIPPFPSSYE